MAHNWLFYSNTHPENFFKFHLLFITKQTIWQRHFEIPDILLREIGLSTLNLSKQ